MKIWNYGSINIDHVYRVPHLVQPGETLASTGYGRVLGGKGANQSIALARAGAVVTHIGRYHAGDLELLNPLFEAGVAGTGLQAVAQPGGHAMIQVDDRAENAIVLFPGANHSFSAGELPGLLAQTGVGDWLLLQNECSVTGPMIEAAFARGLQIAFNPAPMTGAVRELPLDKLSLLFVNQVEVLQLLGAGADQPPDPAWLASALRDWLPDTEVIVTLGAQGASRYYRGGVNQARAYPVPAVDTTGAGDTFTGFYLAARLAGQAPEACLRRACMAAALCVQRAGASASIPAAAEVDAFAASLLAGA
ncbi:MAG: ribokinase [Thiothrix sp.]|nr:ribokinase [Thiothrix sp.]HPE60766.1 ribokinase [Thiolinea sp.]